jgi:hypothetical protein
MMHVEKNKSPEGQGVQLCIAGTDAKYPGGQKLQADAPVEADIVEGKQRKHSVNPADGAKYPAAQAAHVAEDVAPTAVEYVPAPHS